jgi:LuxR family quorum sensing-dependent transcriptional regulator
VLLRALDLAQTALRADTAEGASAAFYEAMTGLGASYLQTRVYRRPLAPLTSASHFAAGGVVARIAPPAWPGSPAFNYVCFECNPLLNAIRGGLTRYRFSDFAPKGSPGFDTYWEALSEARIDEALCATSYGPDRAIASLHLGFERGEFGPDEALSIHMAGLLLTERLMSLAEPGGPDPVRLTDRERDSLAWVAEGKSDWEIAVILGLAESTVRFHVDNARRKLGAVNRTQAVARLAAARML